MRFAFYGSIDSLLTEHNFVSHRFGLDRAPSILWRPTMSSSLLRLIRCRMTNGSVICLLFVSKPQFWIHLFFFRHVSHNSCVTEEISQGRQLFEESHCVTYHILLVKSSGTQQR